MAYREEARILEGILTRKGGIKTLAFDPSVRNKRKSFALVTKTLRASAVLEDALRACSLLQQVRGRLLRATQRNDTPGAGVQAELAPADGLRPRVRARHSRWWPAQAPPRRHQGPWPILHDGPPLLTTRPTLRGRWLQDRLLDAVNAALGKRQLGSVESFAAALSRPLDGEASRSPDRALLRLTAFA